MVRMMRGGMDESVEISIRGKPEDGGGNQAAVMLVWGMWK